MPEIAPNILVATLCYGGLMSHEYAHSVLNLVGTPGQPRASVSLLTAAPVAYSPGARNALVKQFLDAPGTTHLLFIDANIRFEPQSVYRLLAFGEEVVAGVCSGEDVASPSRAFGSDAREVRGEFVTTASVRASFMMIRRSGLERLLGEAGSSERTVPGLFDAMVDPATGDYIGEDDAFCHRVRAAGGTVWVDTKSNVRRVEAASARGYSSRLTVPTRAETFARGPRSSRLVLAPVAPEDAAALWSAIEESRHELEAWLPTAPFSTDVEAVRRHVLASVDDWDHERACRFTIRRAGSGELFGMVGFENLRPLQRSVEIGYWIRTESTGRGIATEACRMLLSWAFSRMNAHRICAAVSTENHASLGVVRRLGFRLEGIARHAEQCQGRWLDDSMFALLEEEMTHAASFATESTSRRGEQAVAPLVLPAR